MPPRRPGGKYKGKIPRNKGEATLQAEAEARARQDQENYIKFKQEQHQRRLLAGSGMQHARRSEEDERKQRILNVLMGGRKNNTKKFFHSWVTGVDKVLDEKTMKAREDAWRSSCGHVYHDKENCEECAYMALRDPVFLLPRDEERQRRAAGALSPAGLRRITPGNAELRLTRSAASLPQLVPFDETGTEATTQEEPFLNGDVVEAMHHATGNRCLIDSRMRMTFAPPAKSGLLSNNGVWQGTLRRHHSRVIPRLVEASGDVI